MKKISLIVLFFVCIYSYSNCQNLTETKLEDPVKKTVKYRKLKLGLDYASTITFKGRQDSSRLFSISPYLDYRGKYGLFAKVSLDDVPGTKKGFDELNASIGWDHSFTDKLDCSIGYSHYFYNSQVARIKASVSNEIAANISYDWDWLYTYIGVDLDGGNNKFPYKGKIVTKKTRDVYLVFSNSHEFSFDFFTERSDNLTINPGVDFLFGTQNFLVTYKGKTDPANATNAVYQKQASRFALTGIMLDLDIKYTRKKLTFFLSPNYTFPKNVPPGESSTPYLVVNASVYLTFKGKKK